MVVLVLVLCKLALAYIEVFGVGILGNVVSTIHKSMRIHIRRSMNTYVNIDISINVGICINNNTSFHTNMNMMICIRRFICISIIEFHIRTRSKMKLVLASLLLKYSYTSILVY